jgi:3-oxoacyl-[acyl-carrier protein] reductase
MTGRFNLEGRTALVTGASQGIGEAVARRLAAQRARVVLAARSVDKLERIAAEIGEDGGEALPLALDLSQPAAIADRLGELPGEWAAIDILVNNAGITADTLMARMKLDDWERVVTTNLTGSFAVTRHLIRGMMRRRWGRIVSISSVVGLMGNAGQANYAASKAGLVGFSKSLAREVATRGITVNVVAPGYVRTAMTDAMPEAAQQAIREQIPTQRLGEPDDIAWSVLFLASEEAGYITGHVLNCSGGLLI